MLARSCGLASTFAVLWAPSPSQLMVADQDQDDTRKATHCEQQEEAATATAAAAATTAATSTAGATERTITDAPQTTS